MRTGRRAPRLAPRRWWRPTARDGVVVAGLVVWAVIGSQTSDDGYILGIARARESAGYIGNYYRWFNVPEAPFGWFYELYAVWVQVSDNVLWMRLPSVFMGIVSWMLISREMLPAPGPAGPHLEGRGLGRRDGLPDVLAALQQRAAPGAGGRHLRARWRSVRSSGRSPPGGSPPWRWAWWRRRSRSPPHRPA